MDDPSEQNAGELPADLKSVLDDPVRTAALRRLDLQGTSPDAEFNCIVDLAARLLKAPVALATLMAPERQWFKAAHGTPQTSAPIEASFCIHALAPDAPDVLVVPDALADPVYATKPVVVDPPNIRFYAGTPIVVFGEKVGTLCVFDVVARPVPSDADLQSLKDLAALAASLFSQKDGARRGEAFKVALVREEKRHALALEAAAIASWVWDVKSGVIECDPLLPRLFDLPECTRLPASDLYAAIDPRNAPKPEERILETLRLEEDYAEEYRIRSHPPRWLAGRGRVVERDEDGNPLLVFGVNYDITTQKSHEEHQRLLLRELNHRVKNTLATVQALATQTVRHSREPSEFLAAFGGRLQAIGAAHGLLSDYEWRGIGLDELIRLQVMPYIESEGRRIHVDGPDLILTPDQALALGLVLHELASNAVKYGSLSVERGTVALTWKIAPDVDDVTERLTIEWQERGGPEVAPPQHKGFGSILIARSLGKLLSSNVEHVFDREGVSARISLVVEEADQSALVRPN